MNARDMSRHHLGRLRQRGLALLGTGLLALPLLAAETPKLIPASPQALQHWQDLRFAMFIHWGLYSELGGKWNDKTYYGIAE